MELLNSLTQTINITWHQAQVIIVAIVIIIALRQAFKTWNTLSGR